MSSNILFYIVFIGQIFLLSFYVPGKILGRMKSVRNLYPPTQYPKLYPKSDEFYKKGQRQFKMVNQAIFLLGIVILLSLIFVVDHASFADDGFISEIWPAAYGLIQFMPLLFLEFSEFNQFKMMRKANQNSTRKAELRQRRLFGFVSPAIVGLAVILYVASILLDLYLHDFVIQWDHDTTQRTIVLTITNLFLAGMGAWHLHGRKLDPHQAFGDRAKHISANLKSALYVSMAMSVYFMTASIDDVYDLDFVSASLLSLYFQVIVMVSIGHMLRSMRLEDMDFEVYRSDVTAV
jgi:hypothetical protein